MEIVFALLCIVHIYKLICICNVFMREAKRKKGSIGVQGVESRGLGLVNSPRNAFMG